MEEIHRRERLKQIGFPDGGLDETLELLRLDNPEAIRTEMGRRHWDLDFFQWFLPRFQNLYNQDSSVRERTIRELRDSTKLEANQIEEYVTGSGNIPTAVFTMRYQLRHKKPLEKGTISLLDSKLKEIVLRELRDYVGV